MVLSLETVVARLTERGDHVTVIHPAQFRTIPCPTYPEIRLALTRRRTVARLIEEAEPHYVHIATEGPLGQLTRSHCLKSGRKYTTSYHTRFPEYISARFPLPERWLYALVRRFHNQGAGCMVATPSLRDDLATRGFANLLLWSRGVDHELFRPREDADLGLPRPIFLYVGRVAVEKNIEAFTALDLPGSKVVVGDGPALEALRTRYTDVHFLGLRRGEELAHTYAAGDVFVFPSRTDTFGNVLLEALASGLPVAAYPVTGPKDVITDPRAGVLDGDLRTAALAALKFDSADARTHALGYSWQASAETFHNNILISNRRSGTAT